MEAQSQIKRTLNQPTALAWIAGKLANGDLPHRSALARQVCEHFALFDSRGRNQVSGCLRALRELEAAAPVAPVCDLPDRASEVQALRLVLVATDEQRWIWNELMAREHPQGAGPLVGAQLRYLIGSAHGWVGGFGFSAAALQLRDRDAWLGWDVSRRRQQ